MDDLNKQGDLPEDDLPQEKKKVPRFLWGLVAATLLAVVAVSAYQNSGGIEGVNQFFTNNIGGSDVPYQYDDGTQTQFALLGDVLVTLTDTKVEVQSYGGDLLYTDLCYMQNPSLEVGTTHAIAYDVGGDDYYVLDQKGLVYKGTIDGGDTLVSAALNASDYLVLTHDKSGYKTTTSVYNPNCDLIYSFNSSSRFVIDAYVSDDNTTLIAVALGTDGGDFVSQLCYYPLTETQMQYQCDIYDMLPLEVTQQGTSLLLLGDTELSFVSLEGEVTGLYSFGGDYLTAFDCSGSAFTAFLLNEHLAGNEGRLVTIDENGEEIASLEIQEEVMNLSISGEYLGVLYSNSIVIYTSDLVPYKTINDLDYATYIRMQSDGSVVVFGRERAQIISA